MKSTQISRVKRKVPNLNSLQATICNVALFKTMKQRQFRDSIYISYNQQGVILDAEDQHQWNDAYQYIIDFIKHKKFQILTFGYDRQVYDNLINGELKQYTRSLKEKGYDDPYPYVNLIHYQRLRKSCEFMSKSRYNEPLIQWEKKNKQTPNFAYLVVEPKERFQEVKRSILGMLKGYRTGLVHYDFSLERFIHVYFNSEISSVLQSLYEKKELDIKLQDNQISMTIYQDVKIPERRIVVRGFCKLLHRLKCQIIKRDQIKRGILLAKQIIKASVLQQMDSKFIKLYSEDYCFVVYPPKEEKELLKSLEEIYSKPLSTQSITQQILKFKMCQFSEVTFVEMFSQERKLSNQEKYGGQKIVEFAKSKSEMDHPLKVAVINGCQFLLQQFRVETIEELSNLMIYLEEYKMNANASLVRFYGICQNDNTYYTILDYKTHSLYQMHQNGELIDEIQVCVLILQILNAVNYLHKQPTRRCLGTLKIREFFVPGGLILPYLYDIENYTVQQDIRIIGKTLKALLVHPNIEIQELIYKMTTQNVCDMIDLEGAISALQSIIS